MLKKLLRRLSEAAPEVPGVNRELATAVLLLEVARADYQDHPGELEAVHRALREEFGLDASALEALMAGARRESGAAVSMYDYIKALNNALGAQDKRDLLRRLWSVAYADGQIEPLEEHMLRRLADLLHVPHHDFISSKLRAADA